MIVEGGADTEHRSTLFMPNASGNNPLITWIPHPTVFKPIRCHKDDIIGPWLFLTNPRPQRQPELLILSDILTHAASMVSCNILSQWSQNWFL